MPRIQFTVTLMKLAAVLALLVFGMGVLAPQPSGPVPLASESLDVPEQYSLRDRENGKWAKFTVW